MYSYTIYTTITSPTLNYIYHLRVYYIILTKQTCYSHALDIIILVSSTMFQIYDITSCDYDHMPLYHPRDKRKRKRKREIKIKYKSLSIL